MTRTATNSEFDHVAIVVMKDNTDPNDFFILEATGNRGVAFNKWSLFNMSIGPDKFYK